ncbi:hypothetical protein [Parafrankia sp. EUN1f]|uniref:hypothetical protein n=1 Tax=Parafrankia sp. EUN1f TaxID=102897 RepID=UPI0001C47566|nr:hypothetical protein [Parafrankia sp. EUN1f]EFC79304.1 hypothetical protein FrEUN1fDRAFT_7579 [Parafrankia sp. EUN1f]
MNLFDASQPADTEAHPMGSIWQEQEEKQAACAARPGGHRWQLEIDASSASVSCADCHDNPAGDYEISMEPIPVRIERGSDHAPTGQLCYPEQIGPCDCGEWLAVNPILGGSTP